MAIQVSKANGRDIRAIMPVELRLRKDRLKSFDSKWKNCYDHYPFGRKHLGENDLIALAANVVVAKSEKGKIAGFGVVLPDTAKKHYMHESDIVFDAQLKAIAPMSLDELEGKKKPGVGRFVLVYKNNTPESAIIRLLKKIISEAKRHPEIAEIFAHLPKELEGIARKAGMIAHDDIDAIYCQVKFEGKKCAPMPPGVIVAYVRGEKVVLPDTRENRGHVWLAQQDAMFEEAERRNAEKFKPQSNAYYAYLHG